MQSPRSTNAAHLSQQHFFNQNDLNVNEVLEWLENVENVNLLITDEWLEEGTLKLHIEDEDNFCDAEILAKLLQTKRDIFEKYDCETLDKAKIRANPFETIRNVFFMNRAAMKIANIDARTEFMFTDIDRNPVHKKQNGPYYFADVCAGPGGFSEYMLWRKKWQFKGFGITLKHDHDFQLSNSHCCSGATFRGFYGIANDGNVCNPDNIKDFAENVRFETHNEGVHFMMSDGGFSVEGKEELQEVLSKQLYTCQCLIALEIVRKYGHFVTKLFDTFTTYSIGLIYLMYLCFDKLTILKPKTSRPANAERYLICHSLKSSDIVNQVRTHLRLIVARFWKLKSNPNDNFDINLIVPLNVIKKDETFCSYIIKRNNQIAIDQIENLEKVEKYCKDPKLIDSRQSMLRTKCLQQWRIPDLTREPIKQTLIGDLLADTISKPEVLNIKPTEIITTDDLITTIVDVADWIFVPLNCSRIKVTCHLYAATGLSKVYKLQNNKWTPVRNVRLGRGTILYGEIITENVIDKETKEERGEVSLHVIDALRLGDLTLLDFNYNERLSLISTYCEANNFETKKTSMRLRPKQNDFLSNISKSELIHHNNKQFHSELPLIGNKSKRETFQVNSILLMKTSQSHFFNTTFALRAQFYIDDVDWEMEHVKYDSFVKYILSKTV